MPPSLRSLGFFDGEGVARAAMRALDWAATPIGGPEAWPAALRTLVEVILGARQPMFVVWGPERSLLYNDLYAVVLANKHPAVGRDFLEVWHEIRADLAGLVAGAYAGEATQMDDIPLLLERKGYPEQTWWHFSYTPIRGEDGTIGGFLCACHEVTEQVHAERRQTQLLELEARLRQAATPRATLDAACEALGQALGCKIATFNELDDGAERVAVTGEWRAGDTPSLLGRHRLAQWGLGRVPDLLSGRPEVVEDVWSDPRAVESVAAYQAIGCRSSLSVPFVRDGRVRAILAAGAVDPRRWSAEDVALATAMVERAWHSVERARVESELRRSEARYRQIVEGAEDFAIVTLDGAGHITGWNRGAERVVGFTAAEALRRQGDFFYTEADRARRVFDQERADARGDGRAVNERWHLRRDGARFWGSGLMMPLAMDHGGFVKIFRDRTAEHEAEAVRRENEERLRLATDHAEVGFWDVDEVNQRLHWPPIVKAMFGVSPDLPVTIQDFYEGLHPEDREATSAAFAAARDPDRRVLYDVEYRTIGKEDGVIRWVGAKGRGVFDEAGRCLRVTGTAIDISKRKAAEQALAESQARLRELNDTLERRIAERTRERDRMWRLSRDPFLVSDDEGRWVSVSPAWSKLLGWSEEALIGRTSEWMEHPDDRAKSRLETARVAGGGTSPRFENRLRTRDGGYRWFAWASVPENGLLYAVARDVTEEKARRNDLEVAQEALRQAQKMEAVGQLTGGIAHDFNNLLQGVAGSLDLIRRKPGDRERVQRWAEAGFAAAERGAKLTGQLLAFSRAQKMELKPVVLSDLVLGFRDMIDRTIGAHIRVVLDLASDGARVLGDEVQIEMAVLNLALNARDAMPEGGELTIGTKTVRIERDQELADGEYVELAVRDTGTGMPPEILGRVFDPFFTTKDFGKGTGLGLSQVYGSIRQAGGAVRIESRLGGGTTVRLLLRQTDDAEAEGRPARDLAAPKGMRADVLVVDDDPDVRRFLVESLDALGFGATEAEDGLAGLAALERRVPDVVILDFAMPGLNGAEVARRVRERHPHLPIIFATGFSESKAIEAVVGEDTPILRKPFGLDDLQRALGRALARVCCGDGSQPATATEIHGEAGN